MHHHQIEPAVSIEIRRRMAGESDAEVFGKKAGAEGGRLVPVIVRG